MVTIRHKGDLSKTYNFLKKAVSGDFVKKLEMYGQQGVQALASNTPVDTGLTANSWYYKITKTRNSISISWLNSNVVNGVPIAIILQYGHGTRTGGWVQGRDYINPVIQPIFDKILEDAWREVTAT